ncbi:MAG TPA: hypothetical protein VMV33_17410 [Rhodocyclaceae bacterium]|nr:hypothetical protein [Rhodocyclaceae bacterium]
MRSRPLAYHDARIETPPEPPMTGERLGICLAILCWTNRTLGALLEMDERQVRRWRAGAPIPAPVARWLEILTMHHTANPPPAKAAPTARS